MIELHGVEKRFGEVTAASALDLRCEDGAITGLLGPNGAGKTTLLRLIGGLLRPDVGHVTIDGCDPANRPFEARRRLAMLPDARGLYTRLTAREHVAYFGRLQGMGEQQIAEALQTLADQLQMQPLLDRPVAGFSQGERMKVILARALVHRPQNVVLDEPTNGLDVMSARAVREMVARLRADGCCVLLSSHVMAEVAELCDRIHVMAAGRIVASGTTTELLALAGTESLEEAFVRLVADAMLRTAPGPDRGLGDGVDVGSEVDV